MGNENNLPVDYIKCEICDKDITGKVYYDIEIFWKKIISIHGDTTELYGQDTGVIISICAKCFNNSEEMRYLHEKYVEIMRE